MATEHAVLEGFITDISRATTLWKKYQIAHAFDSKYKELVSKGLIPGQNKASYVGLCKLAKVPSDSYYYARQILEKEYDQQEYKDKLTELRNELSKGDQKGIGEKNQIKYAFKKMRKWDYTIGQIESIPETIKWLQSTGRSNEFIVDTIERKTGSRREAIEIMKDRGLDLSVIEHDSIEPAPETMPEMLQYQNHPSWDLHKEMEQQMYEKVSDNMHDLLQELWQHVYKAKDILDKIYEQGLRDGLTNQEIRTLITEALSFKGLQERQIRNLLPVELKRTYNSSSKTDIASVNSAIIAESAKGNQVQANSNPEEASSIVMPSHYKVQQRINTKSKQSDDDEQQEEIFQIKPEEYMIEDIPKYDKPLLVEIVQYLDKTIGDLNDMAMKWDGKMHKMAVENASLKTENEKLKTQLEIKIPKGAQN